MAFLEYLSRLGFQKSENELEWLEVRHHLQYIYKSFTSETPERVVTVSYVFKKDLQNLASKLAGTDQNQLFMRVFDMFREYLAYSLRIYNMKNEKYKTDKARQIYRLFNYYQSFLKCARLLENVFVGFDKALKESCQLSWIDFNKLIFYRYFYNSEEMQAVLKDDSWKTTAEHTKLCENLNEHIEELQTMKIRIDDLSIIKDNYNEERAKKHADILDGRTWVERPQDEILADHIEFLIYDLIVFTSERRLRRTASTILDDTCQCLCEDCMLSNLHIFAELSESNPKVDRRNRCHYCLEGIRLDLYHDHIVGHIVRGDKAKPRLPAIKTGDATRESLRTLVNDDSKETDLSHVTPFVDFLAQSGGMKCEDDGRRPKSILEQRIEDMKRQKRLKTEDLGLSQGEASTRREAPCPSGCVHGPCIFSAVDGSPHFLDRGPHRLFQRPRDSSSDPSDGEFTSPSDSPCNSDGIFPGSSEGTSSSSSDGTSPRPSGGLSHDRSPDKCQDPSREECAGLSEDTSHEPSTSPSVASDSPQSDGSSDDRYQDPAKEKALVDSNSASTDSSSEESAHGTAVPDFEKDRTSLTGRDEESSSLPPALSQVPPSNQRPAPKKHTGGCDSKKCDCPYCEVFTAAGATHVQYSKNSNKSNETRNRLRIRLNQRRKLASNSAKLPLQNVTNTPVAPDKPRVPATKSEQSAKPSGIKPVVVKTPPVVTTKPIVENSGVSSVEPKQQKSNLDIEGMVNYIEGTAGSDKMTIAKKKADKKARQKQKKEEEKQQIEEDIKRKAEEARRFAEQAKRDAQRKKQEEIAIMEALMTFAKDKIKSGDKKDETKEKKKGRNKDKGSSAGLSHQNKEINEETIPAMVSIKRGVKDGDFFSTVTITLKGSDQDKLVNSLVNVSDSDKKSKKQKSNKLPEISEHLVEMQVRREDDSNETQKGAKKKENKGDKKNKQLSKNEKPASKNVGSAEEFSMFNLPPGITITKLDGPVGNKNFRMTADGLEQTNAGGNSQAHSKTNSGVIIVDTEKLIQSSDGAAKIATGRKSKKKKNKKAGNENKGQSSEPSMVTLKNPVFQNLSQNVVTEKPPPPIDVGSCAQASIFKNENGMVTIRSSRLPHSIPNGSTPMPNLLAELKPVMGTESPMSNSNSDSNMSAFNAQQILSGLPGIEITKVDKKNTSDQHPKMGLEAAQVSIIPPIKPKSNFNEEWLWDKIFTPKEENMDAAEHEELEAFKRFCQQSVPSKHKEKVTHLNVKDIVLKNKKCDGIYGDKCE